MAILVTDIDRLYTMCELGEGALGEVVDAALLVDGETIAWMGPASQAPDAETTWSARGCAVLPGLVDCHTHAVWAGSRADEFERRLAGVSYTEVLEQGGGILSTVRATRAAPLLALVETATARLMRLRARGVTTVEVKSGYGLSPEGERKMLLAAKAAGEAAGINVVRTFLGAHAVPEEYSADRAGYVQQVIEAQLPICAPEADAIDVYVDRGAFTVEEGHTILSAGRAHGLALRVHAEQVAFTGAAAMAARLGARSADHLERIDAAGIAAMAEHGTIGVLLPGAMVMLRDQPPPVAALRQAGVRMAVATDLNPGSSPVYDPWLCATLAAVAMGLTVEEALMGLTCVAADALSRPDLGRLRVGGPADLVLVRPAPGEAPSAAALVQPFGGVTPLMTMCRGQVFGEGAA